MFRKVGSLCLCIALPLLAISLLTAVADASSNALMVSPRLDDACRTHAVPDHPVAPESISVQADADAFAGFGDVDVAEPRVLATGAVTVHLEADGLNAYNAASLRVYTRNAPDQPEIVRRGMVGQSVPTYTVPLRVWTPNFGMGVDGDQDGVPDVDNDRNWKDDVWSVWLYVADQDAPVTETLPPWDHPLFDYSDLFQWSDAHWNSNYHLPPSGVLNLEQPIHFALALAQKTLPQVYSTTVYIEFAVSDDGGDTFVAYTAAVPLSVTVADAAPRVSLTVDEAAFEGFASLDTWPRRELAAGPLTLTLSAYGLYRYDAATLRVYTRNDPGEPDQVHMGLLGALDRDWTVPVKVWTPNLGAGADGNGDGIPDPENDTNWRDNENAVWVFAFDWNQPISETWWAELPPDDPYFDPNCAWCRPLFNYTDLFKWSDAHDQKDAYGDYVYHLPNAIELIDQRPLSGTNQSVPLYVAADFTDALPQTYSTTLIFEFALSGDKGETVTQSVTVPVMISATVPGDGQPIDWLMQRVRMRPDINGDVGTVKKLSDSYQERMDGSDGGWTYDQALAVMALTAAGYYSEARQVLNGLAYVQNDDGSWFFSYMTNATDAMISEWARTDQTTLYDGTACLTQTLAISNGYPDVLEQRACWDVTHDLGYIDQIGPWILGDYAQAPSPQTDSSLPDKIKYRTYDFRKYMGTNAWVVMAINFYERETGDDTYRPMALAALDWMDAYRDGTPGDAYFGGVPMGRVWRQDLVTDTLTSTYGFLDWPIYVAEHNFDAYAAFSGMGRLTGDAVYSQTADAIRDFVLRELWAPHVYTDSHPEVDPAIVDDFFFPGIDFSDPFKPYGLIDVSCIYLDGQSWSNLALGPRTVVRDKDGVTGTLELALDFAYETMLITDATIFSGTGYVVTDIIGFKESTCSPDLVWSEGSEGMVSALYIALEAGSEEQADALHAQTARYKMASGGVPYSTLPVNPDDPLWSWTDDCSIAGTAWFYFNDGGRKINPFQPWAEFQVYPVYLPLVVKSGR